MTDMPATQDDFIESMLGDFIDESEGLLQQLNENLLALDEWAKSQKEHSSKRCDAGLLNEMFRAAHSLKGLSAMLRLDDINLLTHKMENIFDAARQDELQVRRPVVDLVFQAVDRLAAMIERLKNPLASEEVDSSQVIAGIQQILQTAGVERKVGDQNDAEKLLAAPCLPVTLRPTSSEASCHVECEFLAIDDVPEIAGNYLSIFIDDAETSLDELTDLLLAADETNVQERLLGTCHRIKGSAAAIGLNKFAKLAHAMEDVLQSSRSFTALSTAITEALLAACDAMRASVASHKLGNPDAGPLINAFQQLSRARSETPDGCLHKGQATAVPRSSVPEDVAAEFIRRLPLGTCGYAAQIDFEPDLPLAELKARLLLDRAGECGEVFHTHPHEASWATACALPSITLGIATLLSPEVIAAKLQLDGVLKIEIQALPPNTTDDEHSPVSRRVEKEQVADRTPEKTSDAMRASASRGRPVETLRVDIERLDQLMNLAGQLVINKARFGQIGDGLRSLTHVKHLFQLLSTTNSTLDRVQSDLDLFAQRQPSTALLDGIRSHAAQMRNDLASVQRELAVLTNARSMINQLSEAVHQLDRVTDGIQKSVMDMRMVPIGPLFGRFKRVVRDLMRTSGKDVQLVIHGEKTELDKRMIDELGDPLIHMIRNAVDHGIETPEVRESLNKSRQGVVCLNALHRGNHIIIEIKDDGRGLDPAKIRAKAIAKALISETDAEKLTPFQLFQLIWEPGFSTADKVTEVSGRGMGMDIVRSKIEELSGTVELHSELGAGTCFTIRLPLTMAILPSLLAKIDGDVFAIPVESIIEIVRVPKAELATVHGEATARVRGKVVSVVSLAELLHWHELKRTETDADAKDITLVVIGADDREIGLSVDELIGEEDIVIKSMSDNFRNVEGLAGASILGDGRVSLILDVAALIERACQSPDLRRQVQHFS